MSHVHVHKETPHTKRAPRPSRPSPPSRLGRRASLSPKESTGALCLCYSNWTLPLVPRKVPSEVKTSHRKAELMHINTGVTLGNINPGTSRRVNNAEPPPGIIKDLFCLGNRSHICHHLAGGPKHKVQTMLCDGSIAVRCADTRVSLSAVSILLNKQEM